MSDSDEIVVTKRRTNRLNLDSEEEARIQAEEQRRIDEIRIRKEEKRRKRQEQARQAEQQQRKIAQMERHYEDPKAMMEPDSDSNDTFHRVEKKIKKAFPELKAPKQQHRSRRKMVSESDESDSQSDDQDESDSESESQSDEGSAPKKKQIKKQVKRQKKDRKRQQNMEQIRAARHRAKQVKIEEKDPKEILVGELAIRWWYALPEWPPADFNYEAALNKQGYRLVENSKFRIEENLVDGLLKATPIDGYVGIFKTKTKLVDVRPKETCPTLNFLRSKTIEELTTLLRTALKEQIRQLQAQKYKTAEDEELLNVLKKRANILG